MSTTSLMALAIAALMGLGLVIGIGVLSLLTGGLYFLFEKRKFIMLKSTLGENGFAFAYSWNSAREEANFDQVFVKLYNPFSTPTMLEAAQSFEKASETFARDLDLGPSFGQIVKIGAHKNATITIELRSSKDGLIQNFEMNSHKFFENLNNAFETKDEFNQKHLGGSSKKLYTSVDRSFIAEPFPESVFKELKIPVNPQFAGEFGGGTAKSGEALVNFPVSKVWIEPGCIVCNACEAIYPEVFEVTDTTCIIRPSAPLDDGLKIKEAAEACPVEVIKFIKV